MDQKYSKYCVVKHNSKGAFPDGTVVRYDDCATNNRLYLVISLDDANKREYLMDYDLHFFNTRKNFHNQAKFLKIVEDFLQNHQ
jgi:hypothetical protein